ncbi:MAG TPA: serine/threonine-protein kinase [Bryobacteraceae bacterium]|nr:serine/threonine-protein kinase [Bryobacteraceae bacterium]
MDSIGRYQIVKELGHGAMGIVYQAVDPTIGRQVAIKTIRLDDVNDPDERAKLRERLFREARSAGILSHPGIVTIYDMEERGDIAFIAMEYVDGPTLDQLLSAKQAIAPERLINILRQTAAALDYAHAKGIVHRDIKPANIMIASDGVVKITDFGIAKVTTSQQYTQTGTILGTPNYMSPEQVQGLAVTGRADQFSLAVIAFEMLTGERPFTGEHLTTVVYKIVAEDPPPVQRLNPTLSPQIDAVLRRGLLKKPEGRYNLCIEFISGLDAACANTQGWKNLPRGGSMNMATVATEAVSLPTLPGAGTTTEETLLGRRRSASKWVLPFAAALIVALGLIGLIALQFGPGLGISRTSAPPPAPSASNPPPNAAPASNPPAVAPADDKKPSAMDVPSPPPKPSPSPTETAAAQTGEAKTQLPAETEENPQAAPPKREDRPQVRPRPANGPQDVLVTTEPAGATAVLDNNPVVSCKTPCMLSVLPGRHTITLNQEGYQRENREIRIIDSPIEVPTVNLTKQSGTLMLTSTPSGAAIFVNDKRFPQVTPAQISLPPGNYSVRVEKNGLQKSQAIEIQNGVTNFINIPLT